MSTTINIAAALAVGSAAVLGGGAAVGTGAAITAEHIADRPTLTERAHDARAEALASAQRRRDADEAVRGAWANGEDTEELTREAIRIAEADGLARFRDRVLGIAAAGEDGLAEADAARDRERRLAVERRFEPFPPRMVDPGPDIRRGLAEELWRRLAEPVRSLEADAVARDTAAELIAADRELDRRHANAVRVRNSGFTVAAIAALALIAAAVTGRRRREPEQVSRDA